jgi:transposase
MKTFRDYSPAQQMLLPSDLREWLPEKHLAHFLSDLVDELDLEAIFSAYEQGDGRGQPPYHPQMMVKLLLYAYCTGKPSSRKIEEATYTDVAFRVLTANQHPDHASISSFRKRHFKEIAGLFHQVLLLCEKAGLVKLGHVAIDGTKVRADASRHKAMSYDRMCQTQERLEEEIAALLKRAEEVDAAEDDEYGADQRGDELPQEMERRESRLKVIREAKKALEEEAREKAREKAQQVQARLQEQEVKQRETGKKPGGRKLEVKEPEEAKPEPKAQRNFTDPESRIMVDGATKSFVQGYNAQAAVDAHGQIIVAADVTQQANDKQQLVPMGRAVELNLGRKPEQISADSGYFSEAAVSDEALAGVKLYIAVERQKHSEVIETAEGEAPPEASAKEQMQHLLRTAAGKAVYSLRKMVVEPVFGQIKEARGFRQFSFRGIEKVGQEWDLICLTHNVLKLFGSKQIGDKPWVGGNLTVGCNPERRNYGRAGQGISQGAVALKAA